MDTIIPTSLLPSGSQEKGIEIKHEIAYVFKDHYVGDLEVKSSANGWWMDKNKLEKLVDDLKNNQELKTALVRIGISEGQYYYFVKLHPEFLEVKEACRQIRDSLIEEGIMHHIKEKEPGMLKWAAEKLLPDKYGKNSVPNPTPVLVPIVNNNFGTVNNNNQIDISELDEETQRVLHEREQKHADEK